jgi:hypothetical protein
MHNLEKLDAVGVLREYGLRVSGGSLTMPTDERKGGSTLSDDELALVRYVENVRGFLEARDLLWHLYANFQPMSTYPYQAFRTVKEVEEVWEIISETGTREVFVIRPVLQRETMAQAAKRHGQLTLHRTHGYTSARLTKALHKRFLRTLGLALKRHPFKVPVRAVEVNHDELAWLRKQQDIHGPNWRPQRAR